MMLNNVWIVLPILTPQVPIFHFMTNGGSEFIKMMQKHNKMTSIFLLVLGGGGQDKQAWTACLPRLKITRVGGGGARYPGIACPRAASQPWLTCPQGASCSGGKINWVTCNPVPQEMFEHSTYGPCVQTASFSI